MRDVRLLGTWKSDKKRTMKEVRARRDFTASANEKLASLFGKLEHRYERNRCGSTLNGESSGARYSVVAKNSDSVVLVSENLTTGELISHLHFEGKTHYWVSVGGRFREYFKRVSK